MGKTEILNQDGDRRQTRGLKMSERIKVKHYLDGKDYFWLMHLSYGTMTEEDRRKHWNYAKDYNLIGLDLLEVPRDWNEMHDFEKQALRSQKPNWYDHFEWFCNEMKPNDLVIIANGWDSLLGIGRIKASQPPYEHHVELRNIFFDHTRKVKWETAKEYDDRIRLRTPLTGFDRTLLRVKPKTVFWEILSDLNL
jgi:hypothetical protein